MHGDQTNGEIGLNDNQSRNEKLDTFLLSSGADLETGVSPPPIAEALVTA